MNHWLCWADVVPFNPPPQGSTLLPWVLGGLVTLAVALPLTWWLMSRYDDKGGKSDKD